jgi:hypothetical protein
MMRRSYGLVAWLIVSVALLGCGGSEVQTSDDPATSQAATAVSETVSKAVAVAKQIEASPDDIDAILEQHGLTVETFEDMLYEISSDPELSEAYNAALN